MKCEEPILLTRLLTYRLRHVNFGNRDIVR
jgi:hypothetical protein